MEADGAYVLNVHVQCSSERNSTQGLGTSKGHQWIQHILESERRSSPVQQSCANVCVWGSRHSPQCLPHL